MQVSLDNANNTIQDLKVRNAALKGLKNKKKRHKINQRIKILEDALAIALQIEPDHLDLTEEEFHHVYAHVQYFEERQDHILQPLFKSLPQHIKCTPALLIPYPDLKIFGFKRVSMNWGEETIKIIYSKGSQCFCDVRYVFPNEKTCKEAFHNEKYFNKLIEMNVGMKFISDHEYDGKMLARSQFTGDYCCIWRFQTVIVKLWFARMEKSMMKTLISKVEQRVSMWTPCEVILEKLSHVKDYKEFSVGSRNLFKPNDFKRAFPLEYQEEVNELTRDPENFMDMLEKVMIKKEKEKHRAKKTIGLKHRCGHCGKIAYVHCARCRKEYYCNRGCQKADWENHKKRCRKTKSSKRGAK